MPESTAIFSVEAAGQVYNPTNEFVYLGGNVNHKADRSIEVNRRTRNAWCSFRKYNLESCIYFEVGLSQLVSVMFFCSLWRCHFFRVFLWNYRFLFV